MRDQQTFSFPALLRSTAIWRDVMFHRTATLEPIQQVALRNMRHVERASSNHPQPDRQDTRASADLARIEYVQDQMLDDQGAKSSSLNRFLVQHATFTPVRTYAALLYAEIEYLEKCGTDVGFCDNTELTGLLTNNAAVLDRWKQFRHGFLHPNERSSASEGRWVLSSFPNELLATQATIASVLTGTRAFLHSAVERKLQSLPPLQQWHSQMRFLTWLSENAEAMSDDNLHVTVNQEFSRLAQAVPRINERSGTDELTQTQMDAVESMHHCMVNLYQPPGTDALRSTTVQTMIDPRFLLWRHFVEPPGPSVDLDDRYVAHVIDNLPHYIHILDTVGILLNEAVSLVKLPAPPPLDNNRHEQVLSAAQSLGGSQRRLIAGFGRVCLALLYGLVTPYRKACQGNPRLADPRIDAVVQDRGKLTTMRTFRTYVFHVDAQGETPDHLDQSASDLAEDIEPLFVGFSKFLGSMAAYSYQRSLTTTNRCAQDFR